MLNQPAGHLEDRETLVEAVIRETREETAWRFRPEALVGTYLWRSPDNGRSFLRFAFCGTVDDHRRNSRSTRASCARCGCRTNNCWRNRRACDRRWSCSCLQDYLLGKRQPLESVACLGLDTATSGGLRRQPVAGPHAGVQSAP